MTAERHVDPAAGTAPARLFVAAWPPAEVVAALADLPRPDEPGVRWTRPASWHVTLRFFGRADPDEATEAVRRVVHPPAVAEMGPAVHRLGRNVLCVPVAGLDSLAAVVVAATADVGEPPDPRPFAGHLTLARLRHRGACGLAGHPVAARWTVDAIALVRSTLDPGGARYEVVEKVPLVG